MSIAVVWIRNDLRFHDNEALFEAVRRFSYVILIYVIGWRKKSLTVSDAYAATAVKKFGAEAVRRGFGWVVRDGNPCTAVVALAKKLQASSVFWNKTWDQEIEEKQMQRELEQAGLPGFVGVSALCGNFLVDPSILRTSSGTPFKIFSPFWRALWKEVGKVRELPYVHPKNRFSQDLHATPLMQAPKEWEGGEDLAIEKFCRFYDRGLEAYAKKRDLLVEGATSRLSHHIHFGEISVRYLWNKAKEKSEEFLRQLAWREFCYYVLFHFPEVKHKPYKGQFSKMPWRYDPSELRRWKEGTTGVPIVDAGMRQLYKEGWLPNRVRMITASFLIKHLLHSWEEGMQWYMERLIDADVANNTFGWQWIAGCGVDANPFFRIFHPMLQAAKFDVDGSYVRRYLPELQTIFIAPEAKQPLVVDWQAARLRALAVYRRYVLEKRT